jgi:subtilisin family serine protease
MSRRSLLRVAGVGVGIGVLGSGVASAVTNEYFVGTTGRSGTRAAAQAAHAVTKVYDFGARGQAVLGRYPAAALQGLRNRPDVRYIEADALAYTAEMSGQDHTGSLVSTLGGGVENVDSGDSEMPWGVDRVDADYVHPGPDTRGRGADIAVLDTGLDATHPDLAANVGAGASFYVGDNGDVRVFTPATDPSDWVDRNSHGTHCAGTAAAVDNGSGVVGVAPEATVHAVKVLKDSGSGSYSAIIDGMEYAVDQGWYILSMSLSGPTHSSMRDACAAARDRGALILAAAGNGDTDVATRAPAAYDSVLAVGATRQDDTRASWSNYGEELDIAAPGVGIRSTVPGGYGYKSGTSMATPHVAGAAAILVGAGMTTDDARSTLLGTAEDIGQQGFDIWTGHGLLDVQAAVADLGTPTPPTAPTNLRVTATTETSVSLAWDPSTDDTGVTGYTVYVDGAAWGDSTDTVETVTGLESGTTYDFYVRARDDDGLLSDPSDTVSATTDSPAGTAPTVQSLVATTESPNNPHADVVMEWTVVGSPTDVRLELYEGLSTTGSPVATWSVGATGTQTYREKFGAPNYYTARLVASNVSGSDEDTDWVLA